MDFVISILIDSFPSAKRKVPKENFNKCWKNFTPLWEWEEFPIRMCLVHILNGD